MSLDGTSDGHIDSIIARLSQCEPIERVAGRTAAVAVILRREESFLLIKRAERPHDPWSGHVAFPGGRVQTADISFSETAAREASEEVGLNLREGARFLGYMESFEPGNRRISVVPCLFQLGGKGRIVQNGEVSSYRWVSLVSIPATREEYILERGGKYVVRRAFRFGDYVVWGLTERILTRIAELAGMTT